MAGSKARRGAQRRAEILKAAAEVFLERGYGGAGLDDIIRRSGGSLATLYAQFGSKEGLFAAIVGDICVEIVQSLPALDEPQVRPPEEVLFTFAQTYLDLLLTPLSLTLYRAVVGESARFPELGRAVFDAGPKPAAARLAAYFRRQTETGALAVAEPDLAARQFLEMVKGDLHFRALLGFDPRPSAEEVEACVRTATHAFLDGVLPRS